MSKCLGCGIESNQELCERCFRIKNYNDYKKIEVNKTEFIDKLDKISEADLVVLVVDLLNIPEDFMMIKSKINCKTILALNKFDLMPTNNEARYINFFNKYDLDSIDTFCISCKNNYNIDALYECIKNNVSNRVYFVGYTNSGKSSLINKIIYNYSNDRTEITTSYLANTTLDTIEINLGGFKLIDTPGIVDCNNNANELNSDILKKMSKSKKIKPISYQCKGRQYIIIENIVKFCVCDNDIVIYVPSNIDVKRYYKDKDFDCINNYNYIIDKTCDIVIPNIGFIKVKKGNINVSVSTNMKLFIRDVLI